MPFQKATKTQSILFDREKWTAAAAKSWLKSHGKKVPKRPDETADYFRFRQLPPGHFQKGTFRTIALGPRTGIKAVIGVPKSAAEKNPKAPVKPPWMPSLLVDIATAVSIDLEGGNQLKFPASGRYSLACNKAGNELWIMSRQGGKQVKASDEKAERLFEKFTGFEHDDTATLVQVRPKKFERIGRAMNIVYKSDKFSAAGKFSKYVHAFENYPIVSVDNVARPSIVALRGGRIAVRKEGITG